MKVARFHAPGDIRIEGEGLTFAAAPETVQTVEDYLVGEEEKARETRQAA